MINRVVLVGRLTRDPELKTTTTGKSVCDFSISVNKRIKPSDGSSDADFFRVTCWEKTAEYVSNYLHKGRLVAVDGRLQQRKFTGQDGQNKEFIEVIAESVQGLDRPRDDNNESHAGGGARAAVAAGSVPSADEYDPFADE